MKKYLALCLVVVLALSLAACGGGAATPPKNSEPPAASGESNPVSPPQDGATTGAADSDAAGDATAPEIPYVLPENLKLTYEMDGGDTRTVIKIGDDYYSAYNQNGTDPIDTNAFFFKHNSDGTWTLHSYSSGWVAGSSAWADPVDGVGGLESSNFYWRVLLDAQYTYMYGEPVETSTIASRPVEVYNTWGGGICYVDTETGLVLKGDDGNVTWEVIEWDEGVVDFGDIEIPQ